MSLNVFHPLPMLVHELIKVVLGRTTSRETLFQSLERLVGLVELEKGLELVDIKEEIDAPSVQGS